MWYTIKKHPDYLINTKGQIKRKGKNKIKKAYLAENGYLCMSLNAGVFVRVHRLLAETFIYNPNNYDSVNHKDGNKTNNNLSNLEWCTRSYNTKHAHKNKLCDNSGEKNGMSVIKEELVHDICKMLKEGHRLQIISDRLKVKKHFISSIKSKKSWRKISDQYFDCLPKMKNQYE